MSVTEKPVRQSVSLPARIARRVRALAKTRHVSASHVLVDLIESGLEAKDRERRHFLEVADRLGRTRDPDEQALLKEELARMTFGD